MDLNQAIADKVKFIKTLDSSNQTQQRIEFERGLLLLKLFAINAGIEPESIKSNSFQSGYISGNFVADEPTISFYLDGLSEYQLVLKRSNLVHLKCEHKVEVFSLPYENILTPANLAAKIIEMGAVLKKAS